MPPREKEFDAICLVLDVGLTSSRSGFTDEAVHCASELVQRKLYGESPDRMALVLCGTEKSDNPLDYENITLADCSDGCLCVSDYNLLEYVEKYVKSYKCDVETDFLDGLVVALDFLKRNTEGQKAVRAKKIVLFSDLGCPSSEDKFDRIVDAMTKQNVELVFIGPTWLEDEDENGGDENGQNGQNGGRKKKTPEQNANFAMIENLVGSTNGTFCDIFTALQDFMEKERRQKRPFPWKVDFEMGPDLTFNMTGYIHVRREAPKSWKKCLAASGTSEEVRPEVTYLRDNSDQEVVEQSDLIESYRYGDELIAISEVDKANYDGGPKSLKLVGFINRRQIPFHLLLGDGSMIFLPTEGDSRSLLGLSAVLKAMAEDDMVAIVRRVYRAKTGPKLGLLLPDTRWVDVEDGEKEKASVMVYIELPFMEDIRTFVFAPLWNDKVKPGEKQLEAVDELIDALLIKEDDEDSLVVQPSDMLNPYYLHLYRCLTRKALYPGRILPDVHRHTKSILEQPEQLKALAEKPLQNLTKVFKLEEVQSKKDKQTGQQVFGKRNLEDDAAGEGPSKRLKSDELALAAEAAAASVTEVGTVNPTEDFEKLIKLGFQYSAVTVQLEKVILSLLEGSYGSQLADKILGCLKAYRKASLEQKQANLYNNFVADLKKCLQAEKRSELWQRMISTDLGLIQFCEDRSSSITSEEATAFLLWDEAKGQQDQNQEEQQPNAEDLLEDL